MLGPQFSISRASQAYDTLPVAAEQVLYVAVDHDER